MSDRDDLRRRGPAVVAISLERRRVCRWLLLPAAQLVVPSVAWANVARIASARMWPAQEYTRVVLEAPVSVAAPGLDAQGSASRRPRARRRAAHARARAAPDARAGVGPVHRGDPLRDEGAGNAARGVRPQVRDANAAVRAEAGGRVRVSRRPGPLSAHAARSADGAARGEARSNRRGRRSPAAPARAARAPTSGPTRNRRDGAGSPSRSIRGTAARIPAPSAAAARWRRTSRSRSAGSSSASSTPSPACGPC